MKRNLPVIVKPHPGLSTVERAAAENTCKS
jgi:hypothetical protein